MEDGVGDHTQRGKHRVYNYIKYREFYRTPCRFLRTTDHYNYLLLGLVLLLLLFADVKGLILFTART